MSGLEKIIDSITDPDIKKKVEALIKDVEVEEFGIQAEKDPPQYFGEDALEEGFARVFYQGEWRAFRILRRSKKGYVVDAGFPIYVAKKDLIPSNIKFSELVLLGLAAEDSSDGSEGSD